MGEGNASVKVASVKAELELNYEQFLQGIEEAKSVFNDFADEIDRPLALHFDEDNNFDVLSEKIDEIREELESLGNIDLSDIDLNFNTDGIEEVKDAINEIRDDIEELNNTSVDINVNSEGIDETDDTVERLKAIIESINDRDININVNADGVINATAEMEDLKDSEEETEEQSEGLGETLGTAIYAFQAVFQATKEIAEGSIEQFAQLQMSARIAGNIFGSFGNNIKSFASTSMTSLGMSSGATTHYADMLGFALKAQGATSSSAGQMAEQLVETADNMELASGGTETMQQAVQVLTAAIGGQTFGLKSLGINITGVNKNWTPLHQSMYIMHQVMEKVNKNFGSLSGNLDTTAGQMQIAKSTMEQFGESIGEVLAPQLAEVNKVLGHLYDDFEHLSPAMKKGIVIAGEVGVGLLGLVATIAVVSTAIDIMGKAFEGFTAILVDNPIVAILGAIVIACGLLYESWKHNWLGMRNVIDSVIKELTPVFDGFIKFMKQEFKSLEPTFKLFEQLWKVLKPLVEDILKALGTAVVAYVKMVVKEIEIVVKVVTDAVKIVTDIIEDVIKIVEDIGKVVGNISTYIENKVRYLEDTFKRWGTITGNVIHKIISFFENLPTEIGEFLDDAKNTVVRWGTDVGNFFTETIPEWLSEIRTWFGELPSKIEYGLGYAIGTIVRWGENVYNYFASNIPVWIDDIGSWFEQLPGRIWTWLVSAYNRTVSWGENMLNEAEEAGSQFLSSIGNWFEQLPGRIGNYLENAFNSVMSWGSNMISSAEQTGSQFLSSVGNEIEQLPGQISGWLSNVIGSVESWGSNMISAGVSAMESFASGVVGAVEALPGEMESIGLNIVEGLWHGIESEWDGLMSWVHNAANNIANGFKSALDIHSPSRLMYREVGIWILPGISKAIEDGLPNLLNTITKQVGKMVGHMQRQIKTGVGGIEVPVPESLQNFGDKIFNNKAVWQEPNLISQNQNNNNGGGGYASSGTTNSEIHHHYEIHIHGNNNDPEAIAKEIKRQIQLAQHGF